MAMSATTAKGTTTTAGRLSFTKSLGKKQPSGNSGEEEEAQSAEPHWRDSLNLGVAEKGKKKSSTFYSTNFRESCWGDFATEGGGEGGRVPS
jgi:hypothetical protein